MTVTMPAAVCMNVLRQHCDVWHCAANTRVARAAGSSEPEPTTGSLDLEDTHACL